MRLGAVTALGLFFFAEIQPAAGQMWIQLFPTGTLPSPRTDSSAVYDPGTNRMVMFGGNPVGCSFEPSLNTTWVLTNANGLGETSEWIQLFPSGGPPPVRRDHTAVYNPLNDRMVVFGGDPVGCAVSKYNDVWVLENATGIGGTPNWVQLSPVGGPPPERSDHAAVYDVAHNRMTIYGGFGPSGNLFDVWVLVNADGTWATPEWVQLFPTGGPPSASSLNAEVYESVSNRMTVAGGLNCCSVFTPTYEVWVLTNANGLGEEPQWIKLNPTGTAPSSRAGHQAVYDASRKRMITFAGNTIDAGQVNEVWVLTNADGLEGTPQFIKLNPTGAAPAPRGGVVDEPTAVFDPINDRMTIFGGRSSSGTLNDTWVLTGANGIDLCVPATTRAGNGPSALVGFASPKTKTRDGVQDLAVANQKFARAQTNAAIPPGFSREIFEVKFRDNTRVLLRNNQLTGLPAEDSDRLLSILSEFSVIDIAKQFSLPEHRAQELKAQGEARSGKVLPDLNLLFRFTLRPHADADGFIKAMRQLDFVESIEPAPLPAPPPDTPDLTSFQGYLNPATDGVDAPFSWSLTGGNGSTIRVFDIEYSWNQSHEDITAVHGLELLVNSGDVAVDPFNDNNHGTAVLGELVADFNEFGMTGIAWGASIGLAPADTGDLGYNPANAIVLATAAASPGDVILIEQQTNVCGLPPPRYGPPEWTTSVFMAIETAVSNGIVVIETAGNGNVDLDSATCGGYFDRTKQDSGAIIVGAGKPPESGFDRQRESFSTFGSRVDVQGWGSGVATTGYGSLYRNPKDPSNPTFWYTRTFSGTSSAAPIVAGSAADIQGVTKCQLGRPLIPSEVRELLVNTGSAQLGDPAEHIGPRPNLREALCQLLGCG